MKKITLFITAVFCTIVLTACGGGGSETAGIAPINPTTSTSGKLIIDNGRGTTNNQDTERVK